MRASLRRGRPRETGASAVEFALVLPVLVAILVGMTNLGIVLAQKASLSGAVRSGARYGSVNLYGSVTDPHTCTKTVTRTREGSTTLGMRDVDVAVSVYRGASLTAAKAAGAVCSSGGAPVTTAPCAGSTTSDSLFVVANYSSRLFIPAPEKLINTTVMLESVGVYRCEYQ